MQSNLLAWISDGICIALLVFFAINSAHAQTAAPWVGNTVSGAPCRGGGQGYGPYDYTLRFQFMPNLAIVEDNHFTPQVENLIAGKSSTLMGDIDYTLRAWPNHHRALNSVIRLDLRENGRLQSGQYPPAECYLKRAINYSPKDGTSRMLYGLLLARLNHLQDALVAYQEAERLEPDNLQVKYNLGLLLIDLKRYDEAKAYATEVYSANYPLPGLKRKLKAKGYWKDPL